MSLILILVLLLFSNAQGFTGRGKHEEYIDIFGDTAVES